MLMETAQTVPAAATSLTFPSACEFTLSFEAPADWDKFVNQQTGCFFHQREWGDVLEKGYRFKCLYAAFRSGGRLVFGISGLVFDFKIFKLFFSKVPYGGFIGDQQHLSAFLPQLETALRNKGIHQLRVTRLEEYFFSSPPGYEEKKASQHILNLSGKTLDSLWEGYRKNTRRDINKARRSGITVRAISGKKELDVYYELYQMTMKRSDSLCHYTRGLYDAIYDQLISQGKGAILFADYQGKPIAASLILFGKDRAYLVGNVSHPDYLKLCPNDLLYQMSLSLALERKLSYFDFMTSPVESGNLMVFKEKWGAEKKPFSIFQKDLSPLRCYFWNQIWRFMYSKPGLAFARLLRRS